MSTRAQVLGAQGVVVDGYFRDINEHRDLNFQVSFGLPARNDTLTRRKLFAQGFSIVSSNTFTRTSAINMPLEFTSPNQKSPMIINPGDIILGDADGVVVVPADLVEPCLKLCEERSEVDKKTRECLVNGEGFGPTIARLRK